MQGTRHPVWFFAMIHCSHSFVQLPHQATEGSFHVRQSPFNESLQIAVINLIDCMRGLAHIGRSSSSKVGSASPAAWLGAAAPLGLFDTDFGLVRKKCAVSSHHINAGSWKARARSSATAGTPGVTLWKRTHAPRPRNQKGFSSLVRTTGPIMLGVQCW